MVHSSSLKSATQRDNASAVDARHAGAAEPTLSPEPRTASHEELNADGA